MWNVTKFSLLVDYCSNTSILSGFLTIEVYLSSNNQKSKKKEKLQLTKATKRSTVSGEKRW